MDMSLVSKIEFVTVNNTLIRINEIAAVVINEMNSNKAIVVLRSGFKIQFYDMSNKTKSQLVNLMKVLGECEVELNPVNESSSKVSKSISGSLDREDYVPDDLPF